MSNDCKEEKKLTNEVQGLTLFKEESEDEETEIVKVIDPQSDHNIDYIKSPKSWVDLTLPKELIESLLTKGYKNPSKIQASIIAVFQKKISTDILAQSQNGSGKTIAFCIPSILTVVNHSSILNGNSESATCAKPIVIILSDTKELCFQTASIIKLLNINPVKVSVMLKELEEVDYSSNIVITTMGSMFYFSSKKQLSFDSMKLFVFDECDKLFSQDIGKSKLPMLFKRLSEKQPDCKVYFFSATFPDETVKVITSFKRKMLRIQIEKQELSLKNLTHYYIQSVRKNKLDFVDKFFEKYSQTFADGSSIIFVNSKNFAETFCKLLNKKGHKGEILTSDMDHQTRMDIMNEFKAGKIKILVSTNLIARGIDNRKVSLVINLDLPYLMNTDNRRQLDVETYFHRVGRTGRFGDRGIAVNIVETEEDLAQIQKLGKDFDMNMIEITIENFVGVIDQTQQNKKYNEVKREYLEENI